MEKNLKHKIIFLAVAAFNLSLFAQVPEQTLEYKTSDALYQKNIRAADTSSDALAYLNSLRKAIGMTPLSQNSLLDKAALNHSLYTNSNGVLDHYETSGTTNFTGVSPSDRAHYVGYDGFRGENISSGQSSFHSSVDGLFTAIYHRFGFLSFDIDEVGIGSSGKYFAYEMGSSLITAACAQNYNITSGKYYYGICIDQNKKIPESVYLSAQNGIKSKNPSFALFPYENQQDFTPVFYDESPDPLPDYPVSGNPVSVNFNDYFTKTVSLSTFKLYNADGSEFTNTRLLQQNSDPNKEFSAYEFALFPLKRLDWNSWYTAEAKGSADGAAWSKRWNFKTASPGYPVLKATTLNTNLGIQSGKSYAVYVDTDLDPVISSISYTCDSVSFIDNNTLLLVANNSCYVKLKNVGAQLNFSVVTNDGLNSNTTPPPTPSTNTSSAVNVQLKKGWNMISSPVNGKAFSATSLTTSGKVSSVYAYSPAANAYTVPATIEAGMGYWANSTSDATISLDTASISTSATTSVNSIVASAVAGAWNLLGTPNDTTRSALKSAGLSAVWWYDPQLLNYSSSDTIAAGSGFWAKK